MTPALCEDGLWADADLVLYTADAEFAEYEPTTEWGQETGLVSFSLWARFDDREVPIWMQNEQGVWCSLNAETYHPDPADPVSEAFVEAVADLVDDETANGEWMTTEDRFEAMGGAERLLWGRLAEALADGEPVEAVAVVEWCVERVDRGGEDE